MGKLIWGLIVLGVAFYVLWILAALAVQIFAFLAMVVLPILVAVGVASGLVVGITMTIRAFMSYDHTATPFLVAEGEIFDNWPVGPHDFPWDRAWPGYLLTQYRRDVARAFSIPAAVVPFLLVKKMGWLAFPAYIPALAYLGVYNATIFVLVTVTYPFALVAMMIRVLLIALLRRIDTWSMALHRATAGCSQSGCYHQTALPSFECSNTQCPEIHRDLRPGRLGVLYRRCDCGVVLPTMITRASRSLVAICPSCDSPLSDSAGSRQTIQVPVFGSVASGKTRFILAAVLGFKEKLENLSGSLTAEDEYSTAILAAGTNLLHEQASTQKTSAAKTPTGIVLRAGRKTGRDVEIHVFDTAGELFHTQDTAQALSFLETAHALVFVLDPFTIKAIRTTATNSQSHLFTDVELGRGLPSDAYQSAVERLRNAGIDTKRKSLAVVLPKADKLFLLPAARDLDPKDQSSIVAWLEGQGLDDLVHRMGMDFTDVRYFLSDSMTAIGQTAEELHPSLALEWVLTRSGADLTRSTPTPARVTPEPIREKAEVAQ